MGFELGLGLIVRIWLRVGVKVRLVHRAGVLAAHPLVVSEERAELAAHGGGGRERRREVLGLSVARDKVCVAPQ